MYLGDKSNEQVNVLLQSAEATMKRVMDIAIENDCATIMYEAQRVAGEIAVIRTALLDRDDLVSITDTFNCSGDPTDLSVEDIYGEEIDECGCGHDHSRLGLGTVEDELTKTLERIRLEEGLDDCPDDCDISLVDESLGNALSVLDDVTSLIKKDTERIRAELLNNKEEPVKKPQKKAASKSSSTGKDNKNK